jgi:hypothetical protein
LHLAVLISFCVGYFECKHMYAYIYVHMQVMYIMYVHIKASNVESQLACMKATSGYPQSSLVNESGCFWLPHGHTVDERLLWWWWHAHGKGVSIRFSTSNEVKYIRFSTPFTFLMQGSHVQQFHLPSSDSVPAMSDNWGSTVHVKRAGRLPVYSQEWVCVQKCFNLSLLSYEDTHVMCCMCVHVRNITNHHHLKHPQVVTQSTTSN